MDSPYTLHSREVNPEDLVEAASALSQSQRDLSKSDIENILDKNPPYVSALLNLGIELDLIQESDGEYSASSSIALQLRQANRGSEKKDILRIQLHKYRPFITYVKNLLDGVDPRRAARRVGVFYQLGADDETIQNQFLKLADYTDIVSYDNDTIQFHFTTDILSSNYFSHLSGQLEDELVSRLFLENRLNEDIVVYLDTESFNELVAALRNFGSNPDDAVAAAGRAVETFQRNIGQDFGTGGVDYSGPNGIRELAQALGSDGLTRDRHQLAAEYIGEVRNHTGGHGIDSETEKYWTLSEEVAFGIILASIHYIRSTYRWVVDDQLVV